MEIHLIRHTTPAIEKGIIYGQRLDAGVAPTFKEEAAVIMKVLQETRFDAVFCSPALRCTELADYLFAGNYRIDPQIAEMDFGDWEGKRWNDIPPDELNPWMENYQEIKPPGGENLNLMCVRVSDFMAGLLDSGFSRVALITHAGVMRIILSRHLNVPVSEMFNQKIEFGERRVLKMELT